MSAQKGKDLLLKIQDGASFVTIGGLRTRRLALNADTVDVTDAESSGRWRELLEGAGLKRASVSGTGVFKDQASDALLRQTFFDGLLREWRIVVPDFGVLSGLFQIANLDYRGEYAAEVTFDITLESAGALAFAEPPASPEAKAGPDRPALINFCDVRAPSRFSSCQGEPGGARNAFGSASRKRLRRKPPPLLLGFMLPANTPTRRWAAFSCS